MPITYEGAAQLTPIGSYDDVANATEQPWGRPSVVVLPNGNTFVACWIIKNFGSHSLAEASLTIRCWLLDPDLNTIDTLEVMGANGDLADGSGGVRPTAWRVEDHTVWLVVAGSSRSLANPSEYAYHDRTYVIDAKGTSLSVITYFHPGNSTDLLNRIYSTGVDGNPGLVYINEHNIFVVCAGDIFVWKNGTLIYRLDRNNFDGFFAYGVAVHRDPDNPLRFGILNLTVNWSGGSSTGTITRYSYTVDPDTGAVTEQADVMGTVTRSDPNGDWFDWIRTSTNPFYEPAYLVNSTNHDPNTSEWLEVLDMQTVTPVVEEFLSFPDLPSTAYVELYNDSCAMQVGEQSGANVSLHYLGNDVFNAGMNETLGLVAVLVDGNVSPPRYEKMLVRIPFTTYMGTLQWDTFNEGNSSMDYFGGTTVFATTLLDDSKTGLDQDGFTAYYSTLAVFKFQLGEHQPLRVKNDDDIFVAPFGKGSMRLKVGTEWHHEWSTADDREDITKLRFPLKVAMPNGKWRTVAMFTPDTAAVDSTA